MLPRGGGSVCRDGGGFTVICAKLLNIAQALRRTLPSRSAIHLPLVREGADSCELHAPPTYVEGYGSVIGLLLDRFDVDRDVDVCANCRLAAVDAPFGAVEFGLNLPARELCAFHAWANSE